MYTQRLHRTERAIERTRASGETQNSPHIHVLQKHEFFHGLPPPILRRISSRVRKAYYAAGRPIFSKGDPGHGLLAVLSGVVKISVVSEDGKEIALNLLGAGEIFGEIALLDGGPRTADSVALDDCELLMLDRRDILPLLMEEPSIAIKLLEVLSSRLRRTSDQVEDLSFGALSARLAKALLRFTELQGTTNTARPRVRVTQKELGQIVGLSRERTNWHLRDWERAGYLTLTKGGCVLDNKNVIQKLARGHEH